jgi:glycerate-2-kinase
MKKQSCKLIEAENQKALAESRSKKKATIQLKEAEAYDVQQRTLAEAEVEIIKANAKARLEVAENKCKAWEKEADAELEQSENIEPMRRHMEKMKLNESLKVFGNQGHMVVSGKNGQNVLDFYNKTIE